MFKKLIILSAALFLSVTAQLSIASPIYTVDFTITNNGMNQGWGSNWAAMGFANLGDTITGSFDIAEGYTSASDVTNFLLNVNGTNHAATSLSGFLYWTGNQVSQFDFTSVMGLDFGYSYVYSNNTANVTINGVGQIVCNSCVSIDGTSLAVADVPEPSAFVLLSLGIFALVFTRRRNRSA